MNDKYKKITREQNSRLIDQAAGLANIPQPKGGWIKAVRTALAMSGAALSKRLGGHRTTAAYLERSEQDGIITIKKMQQVAHAMHCRFVYALVPETIPNRETTVESIIEAEELIKEELSETRDNKAGKTEQPKDAKEIVLKIIGEAGQDGVDYQLVLAKSGLPESTVDMAVQKLLEGGILFEPRPGKLKGL